MARGTSTTSGLTSSPMPASSTGCSNPAWATPAGSGGQGANRASTGDGAAGIVRLPPAHRPLGAGRLLGQRQQRFSLRTGERMAGLLAEEKDDEREDQAEGDGKRERDDVHDVRGLRAGIIARPAAKASPRHAERPEWQCGIFADMRQQFLQAFAKLRPMIKTCWEVLLRAEPATSPLGNPDTLVFMMDRTLDTFFISILSPSPRRWLARHPLLCRSLNDTCPCERNPLLRYFVSGEQALLAIAGQALTDAASGPEEEDRILSELQLTFHYLAQHELQTFCDLCRENCTRARAGIVTGRRNGPPPVRRQQRTLRLRPHWAPARAT